MKNKSKAHKNIRNERFDIENNAPHHPRIYESGYGTIMPVKNQ
jgi:hypothetical protein